MCEQIFRNERLIINDLAIRKYELMSYEDLYLYYKFILLEWKERLGNIRKLRFQERKMKKWNESFFKLPKFDLANHLT